ncbi:FecR domain-containing protein [Reichenbachiella sp.]|uniref:FecR family protein n=1 Tax=Reichenbachiella sp. TaxID=2184521 RepID=UPI00329A6D5E
MKEDTKHTELIDLTIKKMANEASQADLDRLAVLLADDPANQSIYDEQVRTWELTAKAKGISNQEIEEEWNRLDQAIDELPLKKSSFSLMKIAAAITVILVSSFLAFQLLFNTGDVEIIADQLIKTQLEDGSQITLDMNTQLSYSKNFNKEKREVILSGEAFFEIARDTEKPFIIHVQNTDIQVLGTSFNVKAEKKSAVTEVVVVTGKVQVSHLSNRVTLLPGEKAVVNKKTGKLFKIQNDDPNFQSWKTKNFIFSDLPLSEVVTLLNDVYGESIYLKTNRASNCPVTVSFEGQSLDSIVKVLANTLDLTVEKSSKGFIIDGDGCE